MRLPHVCLLRAAFSVLMCFKCPLRDHVYVTHNNNMNFSQGAVAQVLDKNVLVKLSLATVIGGLSVETFRKLTVQELLWGYEDRLFDLARPVLNLVKDVPDKLGLLVGVSTFYIIYLYA